MRMLICEWLRGEGYAVRQLPTPSGAAPAEVDVVIVDVPRFRARGAEAVRAVRERYPRAALIGLSTQLGHSLQGGANPARALGLRRLVPKPCGRDELLHAVSDALHKAA